MARTELLAAREQEQVRGLVAELLAEQHSERPGRELTVLVILPDMGYGGIPSLGVMLPRAFERPYVDGEWADAVDVHVFPRVDALRMGLADLELARRDVVCIGPELGPGWAAKPTGSGASDARERRRPRRLTPIRVGWRGSEQIVLENGSWTAAPSVGRHAFFAVALSCEAPSAVLEGSLLLEDVGGGVSPLAFFPTGSPSSSTFEATTDPEILFGPPIVALAWDGPSPATRLRLLDALPVMEPRFPRSGDVFLLDDVGFTAPTFRVAVPEPLPPYDYARLDLRFVFKGAEIPVFADLPAPLPRSDGALLFTPTGAHLDGTRPTYIPPEAGVPWARGPSNPSPPGPHLERPFRGPSHLAPRPPPRPGPRGRPQPLATRPAGPSPPPTDPPRIHIPQRLTPPPPAVACPARSPIAQLVEQPAVNRFVVGSSPTRGATDRSGRLRELAAVDGHRPRDLATSRSEGW